jgi:DNA-binding GntR family transcriptional regulator
MANYRFDHNPPADDGAALDTLTLSQRVYNTIRDEIIDGDLHPGGRLVRRELSKRLGVSPMPVTEALLRLENEGLVESRPLYGCRVSPLTIDELRNDEVLREALECQAARLCAERVGDVNLGRLMSKAKLADRMMVQGDSTSRLGMQTHLEFHLEVANCTGYSRLGEELQRLWFRRLMRLNWLKAIQYRQPPTDWHQQVVDVVAQGDPEAADAKMREHVRFGTENDQEALEELLGQKDAADGNEE